MSRTRSQAMARGLLLAALAICSLAALPAAAQATVVQNSCQYSIDAFYRDMAVGVGATATLQPAPPRHPAPAGTVTEPGQTVTLAGQPVTVSLPDNLPRFGYGAGLLHEGLNQLPINVWIAVKATNTVEGTQIVGPLTVTASTTITVDPELAFVSDTGFSFTSPTLPDTTWTTTGGDVVFSQGDPGAIGSLPVGNGGTARPISGSVVIQAVISPTVSFFMDCQPGATQAINPVDGAGPTFLPATPAPIDNTITGPNNVGCISAQGRLATDAAANLPVTSGTREIDAIGVALSSSGNPAEIPLGASYTVGGASAQITLPANTAATLGRFVDPGPPATPLIVAGKSYPFDLWLTIAATNTVEGTQTVKVSGTYSLPPSTVGLPDGAPGTAVTATVALPSTTWTPSGAGAIRVSAGQPGSMGPITVTGVAATDPLGATATTTYSVSPFGSIVLRAATERNATTFDCMPAAVDVTNTGVAFSNLGRTAAAGRYAIRANPRPDAFATTNVLAPVPPAPPAADVPLPQPAAPPPASPLPKVAVTARSGPGKFGFTKLKPRKGKIKVVVSCAASKTTCAGTLQIRTVIKQRLTRTSKRKLVTVARNTRYTVKPGKLQTITLTLSKDATRLLRRVKSVKVKAVLKPSRGASVTRTLNLTR